MKEFWIFIVCGVILIFGLAFILYKMERYIWGKIHSFVEGINHMIEVLENERDRKLLTIIFTKAPHSISSLNSIRNLAPSLHDLVESREAHEIVTKISQYRTP